MAVFQKSFAVSTRRRTEMVDITGRVESVVREAGVRSGQVTVYCPHTTAAVTINENADASVQHDILYVLEQLIPHHDSGYRHSEGNADAHAKSALMGSARQIPISGGSLCLGTWQGIFFCEFDGPRNRTVIVQVRGE